MLSYHTTKNYQDHFLVVFRMLVSMHLMFGIDLKEVHPYSQSRVLYCPGLHVWRTAWWWSERAQGDLFLINLGLIFMEDNCVPEGELWEMMSMMRCVVEESTMYLRTQRNTSLTIAENVPKYQQVPPRDPACSSSCGFQEPIINPTKWESWSFPARAMALIPDPSQPWMKTHWEMPKKRMTKIETLLELEEGCRTRSSSFSFSPVNRGLFCIPYVKTAVDNLVHGGPG